MPSKKNKKVDIQMCNLISIKRISVSLLLEKDTTVNGVAFYNKLKIIGMVKKFPICL